MDADEGMKSRRWGKLDSAWPGSRKPGSSLTLQLSFRLDFCKRVGCCHSFLREKSKCFICRPCWNEGTTFTPPLHWPSTHTPTSQGWTSRWGFSTFFCRDHFSECHIAGSAFASATAQHAEVGSLPRSGPCRDEDLLPAAAAASASSPSSLSLAPSLLSSWFFWKARLLHLASRVLEGLPSRGDQAKLKHVRQAPRHLSYFEGATAALLRQRKSKTLCRVAACIVLLIPLLCKVRCLGIWGVFFRGRMTGNSQCFCHTWFVYKCRNNAAAGGNHHMTFDKAVALLPHIESPEKGFCSSAFRATVCSTKFWSLVLHQLLREF